MIGSSRRTFVPDFGVVTIRESELLVDQVEDWSEVRSPGRAARRRRQGHPQRIRIVEVPKREVLMVDGVMYAHPVVVAEIWAKLGAEGGRLHWAAERETVRTLLGPAS